ncbi:hypothetical protein THOG11_180018 [Vibrio harveyi]|nr:hypothetical protein THOD03_210019 [Vibrio harveyi]CAH1559407.1 hypothetical protein THOG11_180018 [Vibrio harveyi]
MIVHLEERQRHRKYNKWVQVMLKVHLTQALCVGGSMELATYEKDSYFLEDA